MEPAETGLKNWEAQAKGYKMGSLANTGLAESSKTAFFADTGQAELKNGLLGQ